MPTDEQNSPMTYRERRAAKAERLREWADKRDTKADALRTKADGTLSGIPMGQPILIGHHSEGRHRRALECVNRQHSAALENHDKASEFRSRANNIDAAADHAIYSDDADALDRLTERVAELEAKREQMKTSNAEFRKANRDALKALSPYMRSQALPHPAYELTNLGGQISRYRKRVAALDAQRGRDDA